MKSFARTIRGRSDVQLLLQWRWLVLIIAIPVSLLIETIEGNSHDLHFLDEVITDGLILPLITWVILTFAARSIDRQFKREQALELQQRFMQRLAEHRKYDELTIFLTSFPSTVLPLDRAALFVANQHGRLRLAAEWQAPDSTSLSISSELKKRAECRRCSADDSSAHGQMAFCSCSAKDYPADIANEYDFVLDYYQVRIGVLRLWCRKGQLPTADQLTFLSDMTLEMATALGHAIADSEHAERVYREAQVMERRRIAHQLHDTLAQQVFVLHLGLDQLSIDSDFEPHATARKKLETMRDVAADVYEQVRNNLSILRAWEQVDLTEAVSELARVTALTGGWEVRVEVYGQPRWLSPHTCEQVHNIVREALNNVQKHAQAHQVKLDLLWSDQELVIVFSDDGVGFDATQPPASGHYGLMLMRETIETAGGTFKLDSSPGNGTRLLISIPVSQPIFAPQMPAAPPTQALTEVALGG